MDYVSRQFINLVKHLRKDLRKALSDLKSALYKQTEAIRESHQVADNKQGPPPEVTVLNNLPSSVEVHHNEKDTRDERNYRRFTSFVTTLTLGAIVIYSALVYLQLEQMVAATVAAELAVKEARLNRLQADKAFIATIEQFHLDQRAWVRLAEVKIDSLKNNRGPELSFQFVNSGKVPAKDVNTKLDWYFSTYMLPPFCRDVPRVRFGAPSIPPQGAYTLHDPSTIPAYVENTAGGIQYWDKAHDDVNFFCINGDISYGDIVSKTRHTTHFCIFARGFDIKKFAYCDYQNDMN